MVMMMMVIGSAHVDLIMEEAEADAVFIGKSGPPEWRLIGRCESAKAVAVIVVANPVKIAPKK